ncbi:type II toxin-antitoxin system RelE/ParE family toxin [Candidatus Saccharibacteria bacterium]|nr:type II toxin-antitoxin system RelE/ParE family toxin [Candidatus Saccharibacteria bacterium]
MRYQILISEAALKDIDDIEYYIGVVLLNPLAAKRLVRRIELKINTLSFMPARNKIRDNFYKVKVGNFRIIYKIENNIVIVLNVVYSKRNYSI